MQTSRSEQSKYVINCISSSLHSCNRDPCCCHLGSLLYNIPATIIHPWQLPEPAEIISPHYAGCGSQIHSSEQMENFRVSPKDEENHIHAHISSRVVTVCFITRSSRHCVFAYICVRATTFFFFFVHSPEASVAE